nr:hypothetical protein 9 [bacterium]
MSGLKDWFPVFKAGKQTDSAGKGHTFTTDDLDKIVEKYQPDAEYFQEAPVVLGHPKDNAPAFGWIESLKREGNTLFVKCKDIVEEFEEAVKDGRFPYRSISLYPDLRLRHLGFLGAVQPAVKGLGRIAFAEDEEQMVFEFAEEKEFESDGYTDKKEDLALKKDEEKKTENKQQEFSQADIDAKDNEIAQLKAEKEKMQADARQKDFNSFCEGLVGEGRLLPAQKDQALSFMEIMHNAGEFEFSEGEKQPAVDNFKEFLKKQPVQIEFSEVAKGDIEKSEDQNAGSIAKKALEFQSEQAKKGITIRIDEAVEHVSKEK